jgi:hypothetical protein
MTSCFLLSFSKLLRGNDVASWTSKCIRSSHLWLGHGHGGDVSFSAAWIGNYLSFFDHLLQLGFVAGVVVVYSLVCRGVRLLFCPAPSCLAWPLRPYTAFCTCLLFTHWGCCVRDSWSDKQAGWNASRRISKRWIAEVLRAQITEEPESIDSAAVCSLDRGG